VIRPPPAPIVSAALSGFVIGVLATLLATGSIAHSSGGASSTPVPTPLSTEAPNVSDAAMGARLRVLVARELGPSPAKSQPRLIHLSVSPSAPINPLQPDVNSRLRTVVIRFRLNDHPLGGVWRVRAAKGDVFLVLRGLYTSGLPVGNVEMIGVFPLKSAGPKMVLQVYMETDTAAKLQWRKLGRNEINEGTVWKMLDYKWIDPRFGQAGALHNP
jgi:hypothetical protein